MVTDVVRRVLHLPPVCRDEATLRAAGLTKPAPWPVVEARLVALVERADVGAAVAEIREAHRRIYHRALRADHPVEELLSDVLFYATVQECDFHREEEDT